MVEQDRARPLAPVVGRSSSDDEEVALLRKSLHQRRCIKCCGCATAILLLQAVVIIILIFTVFKIKDPVIRMNNFTITQLELINGTTPKPGVNMSVIADVSVKNPNAASFRYSNTTTTLYFYGTVVGEARGPSGHAKAQRTTRMNVTVDIIPDRLISNPNLNSDLSKGVLNVNSYSIIPGRVKMLGIIKKHVTVKLNCSVAVNISSKALETIKCKRKVNL